MTPDMRREFETLQADLIADYVLMLESAQEGDRKVRGAREIAESLGMLAIVLLGIVCVVSGLAALPADLVMIIPNGAMLAYRHVKGL